MQYSRNRYRLCYSHPNRRSQCHYRPYLLGFVSRICHSWDVLTSAGSLDFTERYMNSHRHSHETTTSTSRTTATHLLRSLLPEFTMFMRHHDNTHSNIHGSGNAMFILTVLVFLFSRARLLTMPDFSSEGTELSAHQESVLAMEIFHYIVVVIQRSRQFFTSTWA